jgi:hypothetical protein
MDPFQHSAAPAATLRAVVPLPLEPDTLLLSELPVVVGGQ